MFERFISPVYDEAMEAVTPIPSGGHEPGTSAGLLRGGLGRSLRWRRSCADQYTLGGRR